jgi:hypothetical protein
MFRKDLSLSLSLYIYIYIYILSRVLVTETGFGLVIGFINRLQLVTTNSYYTVTNFYSTFTSSHLELNCLIWNSPS